MLISNRVIQNDGAGKSQTVQYAWMRVLFVKFTSEILKQSITIGMDNPLSIEVDGEKYMSTLKDTCTIKINNLTYSQAVQIITGKYFDVEVWCGYKKGSIFKIFDGGIIYISNDLNERKTNIFNILCANKFIAKYQEKRLALNLNNGINIFTAYKQLCREAEINNTNISNELKEVFLQQTLSGEDTLANWFESFGEFGVNVSADASTTSMLSVYDVNNSNNRVVNLSNEALNLTRGYPRLTSEGLKITLLPVFDFTCGDIIVLDPSMINVYVSDQSEIAKNYAAYLNSEGRYLVYQVSYSLANRDSNFSIEILAKSQTLINRVIGK